MRSSLQSLSRSRPGIIVQSCAVNFCKKKGEKANRKIGEKFQSQEGMAKKKGEKQKTKNNEEYHENVGSRGKCESEGKRIFPKKK